MTRYSVRSLIAGVFVFGLMLIGLFVLADTAHGQGPEIKGIQIAQSMGNQSNKYVAGKDTVIRVLLAQATAVNPAEQRIIVQRNGETVATLEPQPASDPKQILDFTCPSRAACGDWKAGDYTFQATIGTVTAQATAKFQERRALRLLAVPVKANYGPGDVRSPGENWKKQGDFLKQVYPISPEGYKWTLGQELDLSDDKYNLKTDDGQTQVWQAVANLQPPECSANPKAPQCYDLIIGFVKDRQGPDATIQGYTMGAPANIVTESDEDAPATVAHEVAHVFSIGDEYDKLAGAFNCTANPPPPDYVGRDWNDRGNTNYRCEKSTTVGYASASGSTVTANGDFPFEVGGRGALPDMISFMGSGAKQENNWITRDIWSWLFDQLAPGAAIGMLHLAAPAAPIKYVAAFGYITPQGVVSIEPWYSFTDTTAIKEKPGKYSIQAVDALSNTLAAQSFNLDFFPPDSKKSLAQAPFDVAVPFPDKTAAFRIISGTQVLKVVPVTPNAPEVKIVAPVASETITGTFTIKWNGADKDGDKLFYTVEYSDNGDDWITLATEITSTVWMDDFSTLPGSDKPMGRIKVTATDGINATEATSELFSIPVKSPEVFIEDPLDNVTVKFGEEVAFSGSAYDLQDDWIYDDKKLVWNSDLQGTLGGGETLYVDNLKAGTHKITLQATNSFGLSATASITVTVTAK